LPNVGPYIYDVSISGFTRSSIYIYDISSLRVNDIKSEKLQITSCNIQTLNKYEFIVKECEKFRFTCGLNMHYAQNVFSSH